MRIRATRPQRQRAGARLFFIYAVASLIPLLGLGTVMVQATQRSGHSRALSQGRAQAEVIMQTAIAPALGSKPLTTSVAGRELARLRAATDLAIYSGTITAVRLRSFSGTVAFSDDNSRSDAVRPSDHAFSVARTGGTSAALTAAPNDIADRTIRVLLPVVPNTTGEATGVLELYLPYAPIAAAVRRETHQTYVLLGAGLAALYVVLGAISWSTTRRLRRHAARQAHQARHDPLTSLPNRAAFRSFAQRAIDDRPTGGALVLIDLNRFKEVNDTFGHHAGDQLLQHVAERLMEAVRTDDQVARLGGDEFGMILPGATDRDEVFALLEAVHHHLGADVVIEGTVLSIEASFGVALFPEHGTNLDQLLIDADAAMYQGKRGVRPTVIFQPGAAAPRLRSHEVHAELQRALETGQFVLHYQPKVSLTDGGIVGVEALARWNHPTRGLLPPSDFLPVVEASTLMEPFTRWALRRALGDQREWRKYGKHWPVSVNVSAHDLEMPNFVDDVVDILGEVGGTSSDLMLEFTETALAADSEALKANIVTLARLGVAVSVDDFGTGSTGLLQLRGLAVREIKIDQVFVRDLAVNTSDQNLARAMVQLAHGMDCTIVAEGVEDEATADYLRTAGCDLAQGYLYQRPAPWTHLVSAGTDQEDVSTSADADLTRQPLATHSPVKVTQ